MLVFLLIVMVLIGVAYADYCLIDNTAHFGISFAKVAEAEEACVEAVRDAVDQVVTPAVEEPVALESAPGRPAPVAPVPRDKETPFGPPRNPAHAWLLLELAPVLELHEG